MIKYICLQNFQSHKNTMIDLTPGVNVIVGPSDSGKTAILRALGWVVNNRPAGDAFRSNWGGDTSAEVGLEGDLLVRRAKTQRKNEYALADRREMLHKEMKLSTFKAIGQGVPGEISSALNMDEINVQGQMDAPFLLADSPAEVARKLNRVASLDSIDRAHSNINSMRLRTKADLAAVESTAERLREKLSEYSFIGDLAPKVEAVVEVDRKVAALQSDVNSISSTLETISDIDKRLSVEEDVVSIGWKVEALYEQIAGYTMQSRQATLLGDLLETISKTKGVIARLVEEEKALRSELDRLMPSVCPLCGGRVR